MVHRREWERFAASAMTSRMTRRTFLGAMAASAVLVACDSGSGSSGRSTTTVPSVPVPSLPDNPFTLGVASGDPAPDGFVLWTRLAPNPLEFGGGMPEVEAPVRWFVATDEDMRDVVREGYVVTGPDRAHAVHAIVDGLEPDRPYWFRFAIGDHESEIARTRTFPAADREPDRLRFGFVSCQNYTDGFYDAYRDLATYDLDLVVHLGDYIYESGLDGVRPHDRQEVITLDEYRARYALYKSDVHLRAAHAIAPWLVTWDDHEVENNYTGYAFESGSTTPDPEEFRARRAAGYRAWWEHTPTRLAAPTGPDFSIHRRADFGRLARFHVLDTRQFRSDQPCAPDSDIGDQCEAAFDPAIVTLGAEQERWLFDGLDESDATWNVLAQQIVFSYLDFVPGDVDIYNLDQWDGYPAARARILEHLATTTPSNPVVITGDIHASGVARVLADFADPSSAVVGSEFVGTSISSGGSSELEAVVPLAVANNPHVQWADASKRGWVYCDVTAEQWNAEYRHVDDATIEGSEVRTATRWVIESGRPVEEA
ncbi:MAG TPA: alkaline phosphatase D family protein [Acidimicrobiia bacterium]|nr:alkaline phosphatase D family protein [Acidimicrobiia bacterium]